MIFEKIYENIYRINVSLPNTTLSTLNAYLIKGEGRSLLVDNGFNIPKAEKDLQNAFKALNVDPQLTDLFITHLHSDHSGLTSQFFTPGLSKLYCSKQDGEIINQFHLEGYWEERIFSMEKHGFPVQELQEVYETHPERLYAPKGPFAFSWVEDGDSIEVGRYRFRAVATPGHSPGHMTLFEESLGIYLCGDHILAEIMPNVTHNKGVRDAFGDYLASLDRSVSLDPSFSLPGHRGTIENIKERVGEIKKHYEARMTEIQGILKRSGALHAYTVASRMRWSINAESWNKFPASQRWSSTGETLVHLLHLEAIGKAIRIEDPKSGMTLFSYL